MRFPILDSLDHRFPSISHKSSFSETRVGILDGAKARRQSLHQRQVAPELKFYARPRLRSA